MTMVLIGLFAVTATAYYWAVSKRIAENAEKASAVDPQQQHLAALLLVSTSAFDNRNNELYQAAIKEIVYIMSDERWKRAEIEWRIRQAALIAKQDTTPEIFEKVTCIALNIARVTVRSAQVLPWEARPPLLIAHG